MAPTYTVIRAATLASLLAGIAHLLVPDRLLATASWGYDRVLAVEFEPREPATTRVRLVGLGFVLAAALLALVGPDR